MLYLDLSQLLTIHSPMFPDSFHLHVLTCCNMPTTKKVAISYSIVSESQQSYIHSQACWWIFSGFSVSCCINRERLSVTNLSSGNNLPTFRLNAPVVIRAKVKEVRNNIAIYSHALLRICVIGGQRSVRIAPPSCLLITAVQQPGTSYFPNSNW